MNIVIGSDYMPGQLDQTEIYEYINYYIPKDLKQVFADCDYRVLNLETPVTMNGTPIVKCGSNQKTNVYSLDILKDLHIDLLALANNHIMDYGEEGLIDTIMSLDERGIHHIGAGKDLNDAGEPFILSQMEQKVGFYNCCEHEFSIATSEHSGANPYDPLVVFEHVNKLKQQCDCVIVIYHGGKEYYPYPTPELQRVCRVFIDHGADLVVVQHTHCIGCEERYKDGIIVYGQGDFISTGFSKSIKPESMIINFDTVLKTIKYIPFKKDNSNLVVLDESHKAIMEYRKRSESIKNEGFVDSCFREYINKESIQYLKQFAMTNSLVDKVLNKITKGKYTYKKSMKYFSKKKSVIIDNLFECESHRECVITALKQLVKDI